MKKGLFIYLLLAFFLISVAYVVLNLSAGRTTFFGRASGSGVFTASNSYIFASPLSARAGGDKIRVTVFALDGQGKGIPNKVVSVNCVNNTQCLSGGVTFAELQPQTDTLGQAIFDLTAAQPGKYDLQAIVEGISIPQTVTVNFQ